MQGKSAIAVYVQENNIAHEDEVIICKDGWLVIT